MNRSSVLIKKNQNNNFHSIEQFYIDKKIKNKFSLNCFEKKNFFEKLLKYDNQNEKIRLKNTPKEDEYFSTNEQIVFSQNKLLIVYCRTNFTDSIKFLQKFIIYPLITVFTFFFIRSVFRIRIISTLFSGFFCIIFLRMNYGINNNKKHIITKMFLLDNGKECEIHTLENSFVTDIKNIRRLQLEEGFYLAKNINNMKKNYIPLAIDTKLYLIPLISIIQNQEILSAVSTGKYIKVEGGINEENSIDIEEFNKF